MERTGQWLIVGIVLLVVIIIVIVLAMAGKKKRRQSLYSASPSASEPERIHVEVAPPPQPRIEVKAAIPVVPKVEVMAPSAPILRCYDYFEFPKEGGFQVKTCSAPQRENQSIPSNAPKRIFLQWFPVENASEYHVYANAGADVDASNFRKKWIVGGSSHYFESEELTDPVCWSVVVTSINKGGVESVPSTIYSTCSV
jgi:hypothetical protein